MAKPRWTRWLRALFVVPVVAFALSASSHLEVRCALTGLLVPDCCPGAEPAFAPAPPQASIGGRDCCERTVVSTAKLPATSAEPAFQRAPLALGRPLSLPRAGAVPPLDVRRRRADAGLLAPPAPAFLLTHAFLI